MIATIEHKGNNFKVNLSQPIDISLNLSADDKNPRAWYVPQPRIEPVVIDQWVGEVKQGASVNFFNIYFNPHGHGTHTECVGHISETKESVNDCVKKFFYFAKVITLNPKKIGADFVITKEQLSSINPKEIEAIIIRTTPNDDSKKSRRYSNTNPPYLHHEAASYLKTLGVQHLLIDLPSVDKEKDDGQLLAHHAFWNHPENPRLKCSITELIYVPNSVKDGNYLLNLNFAPFENDASPSRPTLYALL